ncbi:MAG: hypothetical protein LQ338_005846 [Usnochroma carphineum]|nr:MAG: hypothetical protein LQ338_005846 [Usnochroma carphineum]
MTPEDLHAALQSLTIGRSDEENHAFVKLSLSGWRISTANIADPATSALPASSLTKDGCADTPVQPTDLIEANFATLNLKQDNERDFLFLCTASDCPLKDRVHTKGYFMTAPGRGIIWHEDFGYSDPPAYIWAAYFRYTRYRKEIGDHCRSVDDFVHLLLQRPFDDARPEDVSLVLNFMRYHAVTLQQGERHVEVVALRGRVLSAVEPEIVKTMSSLRL